MPTLWGYTAGKTGRGKNNKRVDFEILHGTIIGVPLFLIVERVRAVCGRECACVCMHACVCVCMVSYFV